MMDSSFVVRLGLRTSSTSSKAMERVLCTFSSEPGSWVSDVPSSKPKMVTRRNLYVLDMSAAVHIEKVGGPSCRPKRAEMPRSLKRPLMHGHDEW